MTNEIELSDGAYHYLVAALWSTCGYEDDCENLDDKYDVDDISEEFKKQAQKDFDEFFALSQHLFTEDELENIDTIGHDFWLTRNGHGAGFWDGDYEKGREITKIVKDNFSENSDELRDNVA